LNNEQFSKIRSASLSPTATSFRVWILLDNLRNNAQ